MCYLHGLTSSRKFFPVIDPDEWTATTYTSWKACYLEKCCFSILLEPQHLPFKTKDLMS